MILKLSQQILLVFLAGSPGLDRITHNYIPENYVDLIGNPSDPGIGDFKK